MVFDTILLIVPPQHLVMEGFRTALVALASYLKRHQPELDVKLLDLSSIRRSEIKSSLEGSLRDTSGRVLAGISTVTADYQAALAVAKELKALDQGIVTVMGGHHVSGDAEVVLRNHPEKVDYIILNEGEIALHRLIKSYPAVQKVPGLAFRADGKFIRNASPPLLDEADLDCVPLTYEGWELTTSPGKFEHVTYVSARGCPLHCAFCAVANQKIRAKSIPRVSEDVRALVGMGFSKLAFEDNFFAHNRRRTRELCESLAELRKEKLHFTWDCQTRIESMDRDEIIPQMESAGCDAVYLGVESLDNEILRFLGKTNNPELYVSRLIRRVAPSLLRSDINCFINLQFGLPNETPAQTETTLQTMEKLGEMAERRGREITVFPQLFVVYPGTFHFLQFVRSNVFNKDVFETFTAWEADQNPILKWLGETFAHGTGGLPLGILDHERLREGKYNVDGEATMRVVDAIKRLDQLPGIHVFRYGHFLVKGGLH